MTRTFDTLDGTKIEVRSNKAQLWRPNSCRCILVYETDTLELDFVIRICELHKPLADDRIVSTVLAHNNAINDTLPEPNTEADRTAVSNARNDEQKRIEALGAGEIRADSTSKDSIETDLRSKGR